MKIFFTNTILPIIVSGIITYYFNGRISKTNNNLNKELEKYKSELEKYKHELDLEKQRKLLSTKTQKDILFIFQNLLNNAYIKEDNIIKRIQQLIKDTRNEELNRGNDSNPFVKLFAAIGINSFSKEVMALRLFLQESAYNLNKDNYELLSSYSLLYKYLYLEYSGIEVDDLYYLRYYLTDFKDNKKKFEDATNNLIEILNLKKTN
ncbi:MAG: hypothetical protein RR478_04115 [Bacilli bacterium]